MVAYILLIKHEVRGSGFEVRGGSVLRSEVRGFTPHRQAKKKVFRERKCDFLCMMIY